MADQQPEALRLADALEQDIAMNWPDFDNGEAAIVELRRLHDVELENADLRDQVSRLQAGGGVAAVKFPTTLEPGLHEHMVKCFEIVKKEVGTEGWAVSDRFNYMGFFMWGFEAARQSYAAYLRAAPACKTCCGSGIVDDVVLTDEGGVPYSEPIKCVKDCPTCKAAAPALVPPYLQPSDLQWLQSFKKTTEDDQSFVVPKEAMKRLAELGVVQSEGFGRYSITSFGSHVAEPGDQFSQLPLKTHSDHEANYTAAFNAKHGLSVADGSGR